MYPGNNDEPTRRMGQSADSRAYSQSGYRQPQDQQGYPDSGYRPSYEQGYEQDYSASAESTRSHAGGSAPGGVEVGKFIGSVLATALVAAIAGWLAAWVVDAVFQRFGTAWANGGNTPTMYAVYGALAAILAGVLWYLLAIGTPDPRRFFGWIIGLLIVAAVVLPLLVTTPFIDGIAAAVVNLVVGLPILALTGAFGQSLRN